MCDGPQRVFGVGLACAGIGWLADLLVLSPWYGRWEIVDDS
jgi:hypothetical protein